MARTQEGALLTQRHRLLQLAIRAAALRDLLALWGVVDPLDLAGTIDSFTAAAAPVVRARWEDSAAVAARYFQAFRAAEGVGGAAAVVAGEPPTAVAVQGLVRAAGLSGIVNARRRGFTPQAAARNGYARVAGTATRIVLDGGRQTITTATAADPAAGRWQRVTSGDCCAFCAMLASRGPAFDARSSRFEAHANCSCSAEPAYEGSRLPAASEQFRRQWEQAQREIDVSGTSNDALNAFRRLREGRPEDGRRNPATSAGSE